MDTSSRPTSPTGRMVAKDVPGVHSPAGVNLYGPPSCAFAAFADHLARHPSPASSEARAIWDVLATRRVDPAVALGFFHHESGCGTAGRAVSTRSWGNLRYRPEYAALAYPVRDADGFAGYPTWTVGALHFAEHLLGRDGTDFYRGLVTVEQIVPKWAPAADGNAPRAYTLAVEEFALELGGNVPKVAIVAGHLRSENITTAGLCPAIANDASVARLRASTGAAGERDYVGDFATRLADALRAAGVDSRAIDCTYSVDTYVTWHPDGVLALHYHRDPTGRAMFAAPDRGQGYHDAHAADESDRLLARIAGAYEARTGIPVTEDSVTLNMTELYTWCFIPSDAWALCLELGNANVDAPALYNGIATIVAYLRDCVLEHLNLPLPSSVPPARRAGDGPPTAPTVTKETIAASLEGIAAQVRNLP